MAAGAGGHGNEPVRAFLDCLAREAVVDDVVQDNAAIAVHRLIDHLFCSQRGDYDGYLVLYAHLEVVLQAVVGAVHDLVDRKGRRRGLRVLRIPGRQFAGDFLQPDV